MTPDDRDRAQQQHADNLVLWRLTALEETLKYMSSEVATLKERMGRERTELADVFPTRTEVQRDYIKRGEMREQRDENREVWTLRFLAIGVFLNFGLGVIVAIH